MISKPVPKPRKSIPSIFQDGSTSNGVAVNDPQPAAVKETPPVVVKETSPVVVKKTPKVKPKPLPRPQSTEPTQQSTPKVKPKTLPKPATFSKPTIVDKTTDTIYSNISTTAATTTESVSTETTPSTTAETSPSATTTTTPTTINIEYKVLGENQQIKSTNEKKKKQQSTKTKSFEAEPYIVVTLQNPDSSPCSPVSPSQQPETEDAEYSEIPNVEDVTTNDDEYLAPVDVVGADKDTSKQPPNANKSKTMGGMEKRIRMKNNGKSKSVFISGTKKKTNNHNYRASLPEINNPIAIENARRRRASEHGKIEFFYIRQFFR